MNKIPSSVERYCIEFDKVSVSSASHTILHNVSCILEESRIAIVGNNGSGKSTFARCATGVPSIQGDTRVNGKITIHGIPQDTLKKQSWRYVNMTFQIPDQQIIMPSVEEELSLGIKHCNFDSHTIKEKLDYALDILQVKGSHPCHSLSAGQKRLLCILSILLIEPHTIILDEPTTFLDTPTKIHMMKFLDKVSQQVIIITHDLFLIESFPRGLCFDRGTIYCDGDIEEVIRSYKTLW